MVLVTAAGSVQPRDIDFMPLTCEYRENFYSSGKIPGSFFRREGRTTNEEILICRLMDRPVRPLFPKGWKIDTQIIASVVSFDKENATDVLAMTGDDAGEFFLGSDALARRLRVLQDVGLGYLRLGQPATTLSGGEAQRLKIAAELGGRSGGDVLYVLDEPTTGLHLDDVRKLLGVLHRLVDAGNTVLLVEHHLDVIKGADWVVDLGPEGGEAGGEIVAEGTPETVAGVGASYTGKFLADILKETD